MEYLFPEASSTGKNYSNPKRKCTARNHAPFVHGWAATCWILCYWKCPNEGYRPSVGFAKTFTLESAEVWGKARVPTRVKIVFSNLVGLWFTWHQTGESKVPYMGSFCYLSGQQMKCILIANANLRGKQLLGGKFWSIWRKGRNPSSLWFTIFLCCQGHHHLAISTCHQRKAISSSSNTRTTVVRTGSQDWNADSYEWR